MPHPSHSNGTYGFLVSLYYPYKQAMEDPMRLTWLHWAVCTAGLVCDGILCRYPQDRERGVCLGVGGAHRLDEAILQER